MGLPAEKTLYSPETYLELERKAEYKSEYFKGEVFAMAGATKEHNRITSSLLSEIGAYLKGKRCNAYTGDMRVNVSENGLYTYPDLVIVCGKEDYLDEHFDTLLNPTVIIEVLSESTLDYDLGSKFSMYRDLPSLKEYIVVSSLGYRVERHIRNTDNTWTLHETKNPSGQVDIQTIELQLKMEDIYYNLEWSEEKKKLQLVAH